MVKNLLEYEPVKRALEKVGSKNTRRVYKNALRLYLRFLNSKEGLTQELTPDDIVKLPVKEIESSIHNFYNWLCGSKVEGYEGTYTSPKTNKPALETTACSYAYSQIRGFYSHNDILFSKGFRGPNPADLVPKAISVDRKLEFFKLDRENGGAFFDRELFRAFLSNMKLRDRAIALALLSTSQDSGDLFRLSVGFVRNQVDLQTKKPRERLYWEGRRAKTGVRFKVFFSKEATQAIRQYLEQERRGAKDNDPLFTRMGNYGRMTPANFAFICREVAIKMGFYENGNGYQNPLRPKRMRHLFRTACDYAGIKEEGYVHVFMGHRSGISARYLDTPIWRLEQEYARVESVLSVFGYMGDELIKVRRELEEKFERDKSGLEQIVKRLTTDNLDLRESIKGLEEKQRQAITTLTERFEQDVKRLEQEFNERFELFLEDRQSQKDELQLQQEIIRELPPVSKEEIVKAKRVLSKQKEVQ